MDSLAKNIKEVVSLKSGVTRLTLTDFRNYAFLRMTPGLRPVIITGENGSGKTNILEAISFLTPGRGLRSARLADIKRFTPAVISEDYTPGNGGWAVSAVVAKNGEEFEIGTAVEKNIKENEDETRVSDRRIVKINGQKGVSQTELGQYVSAIWLTPQMDRLFRGGSQPRRSFLDRLVYAFDTEHAKRTSTFEHLYKQWYQLIKSTNGHADPHWLESLEESMSAVGVAIAVLSKARRTTFFPTCSWNFPAPLSRRLTPCRRWKRKTTTVTNWPANAKTSFTTTGLTALTAAISKFITKRKECRRNFVRPVNRSRFWSASF